ncbi:MAG: hypothetical protein M3Q23_12005 [Actinomycetota bacterium]|nr:hypothetical protein [Actinomycetota bacterium]
MARRSGPVSLVVASILVLAIPVVMMAVSPHRDRGATNVRIQFAAGEQNAPAAQPAGTAATKSGGAAQPAAGRHGSAGGGSAPGRQGGRAGSTQGSSSMGGAPSDVQLRRPARSPVQGGGDTSLVGEPNPPAPPVPVPLPSTTQLPGPLPSVPSVNLHMAPKPQKFVLAKWIARCDVAQPGRPGTMAFDVFYQHHPTGANAFPVDQMNYPCGADWAIIPGSDPFTPPVWIGKTAPFVPATNYPGGQVFTAVEVSSAQVAADLAAAGVPVGSAGQLVTYGSDGVPIYTANWWGLSIAVKDAAGQAIARDGGYPHPMWRTDAYHWGWGNLGVGLPVFKGKV